MVTLGGQYPSGVLGLNCSRVGLSHVADTSKVVTTGVEYWEQGFGWVVPVTVTGAAGTVPDGTAGVTSAVTEKWAAKSAGSAGGWPVPTIRGLATPRLWSPSLKDVVSVGPPLAAKRVDCGSPVTPAMLVTLIETGKLAPGR